MMKQHIFPAIRLTLACLMVFSGIYTCLVWGVAQLGPNQGKGATISQDGKTYYGNIGQSFTEDRYFWSRPSAVDYNAAGSGGSNKGPSNPEYLATVQGRIDTFLVHNPGIQKGQIPADLVTASASGLDPDISVEAAKVQVPRIAKIRNISEIALLALIDQVRARPLLGFLGPEKVNVLRLNLATDDLKAQ